MLMIMFLQSIFILLILFWSSSHPLILGLILMVYSLIYGVILYMLSMTPWMSYILIMVFLSGMMIMFMYMASLSSNEPMNLPIGLNKSYIIFLITLISVSPLLKTPQTLTKNSLNSLNNNWETHSLELVYKTFNPLLMDMTSTLIVYLLVVLLISVKIIYNNNAPLRSNK